MLILSSSNAPDVNINQHFHFTGEEHENANRLICQFYSLLLLFMLYCGTSLQGGIALERRRYDSGILIPDFFLTYLLAIKVESEKLQETISLQLH